MKIFRALLLVIVILSMMVQCANQKNIPKRYFGDYVGGQDAYTIDLNGERILIPEVVYRVRLSNGKLLLESDQEVSLGEYTLLSMSNRVVLLEVKFESGILEFWQLNLKSKKMIRNQVFPLPKIVFLKS